MLEEAIKFEAWSFLEAQFQDDETERKQWREAKTRADQRDEEFDRTKETALHHTRLFRLSRTYPAFNEAALPPVKLKGVVNTRLVQIK